MSIHCYFIAAERTHVSVLFPYFTNTLFYCLVHFLILSYRGPTAPRLPSCSRSSHGAIAFTLSRAKQFPVAGRSADTAHGNAAQFAALVSRTTRSAITGTSQMSACPGMCVTFATTLLQLSPRASRANSMAIVASFVIARIVLLKQFDISSRGRLLASEFRDGRNRPRCRVLLCSNLIHSNERLKETIIATPNEETALERYKRRYKIISLRNYITR